MGEFVQELFRFGFYKRSQGRVARQATFAALAIIFALGAWRLYEERTQFSWDSYVKSRYETDKKTIGATGQADEQTTALEGQAAEGAGART